MEREFSTEQVQIVLENLGYFVSVGEVIYVDKYENGPEVAKIAITLDGMVDGKELLAVLNKL